jgi:hypothetical protein
MAKGRMQMKRTRCHARTRGRVRAQVEGDFPFMVYPARGQKNAAEFESRRIKESIN